MPEIIALTHRITDKQTARLSQSTTKLLEEIIAIVMGMDPPSLEIARTLIYELSLLAISAISNGIVQASTEAAKQLAKKLGIEPSP